MHQLHIYDINQRLTDPLIGVTKALVHEAVRASAIAEKRYLAMMFCCS